LIYEEQAEKIQQHLINLGNYAFQKKKITQIGQKHELIMNISGAQNEYLVFSLTWPRKNLRMTNATVSTSVRKRNFHTPSADSDIFIPHELAKKRFFKLIF